MMAGAESFKCLSRVDCKLKQPKRVSNWRTLHSEMSRKRTEYSLQTSKLMCYLLSSVLIKEVYFKASANIYPEFYVC